MDSAPTYVGAQSAKTGAEWDRQGDATTLSATFMDTRQSLVFMRRDITVMMESASCP